MTYDQFLRCVCPPLDLEWRKYRRRTARRRVEARMEELGIGEFPEYARLLQHDPGEARGFADRSRVTLSRFFRERQRWEALGSRVLPELLRHGGEGSSLRAWSAGCCNGEEPYTLAVLWLEVLQPRFPDRSLEVLATDIDPRVLERARDGWYQPRTLREVPHAALVRRFVPERGGWRVRPEVSRLVGFERHNLMEDPPPHAMDLVLCRYLAFTYYRGARRHRAAGHIWKALRSGGALMIGRKEGLGPGDLAFFEPWPEVEGVFRRRDSAPR